jgi:hypothetical protein
MISRIDHVSIAVKNQKEAEHFFHDIIGAIAGVGMADPASKFFWQILSLGDLSRLEIISPKEEGSFLDGFLKSREGVSIISPFRHRTSTRPKPILKRMEFPYLATTSIPVASGRKSSFTPSMPSVSCFRLRNSKPRIGYPMRLIFLRRRGGRLKRLRPAPP